MAAGGGRSGSNRLGRHLGLAAVLVGIDQATKWIAVNALAFGERVPVIPGFFDFTLVYNRGAAFSFLAGAGGWQRWFFTGIGIVAAVFIVWMLARHGSQRLFALALSLILGGAIGNVIDRFLHGHVVDFIQWHVGQHYWPAFNIADCAVVGGAIGIGLFGLLGGKPRAAE